MFLQPSGYSAGIGISRLCPSRPMMYTGVTGNPSSVLQTIHRCPRKTFRILRRARLSMCPGVLSILTGRGGSIAAMMLLALDAFATRFPILCLPMSSARIAPAISF